VRAAARRPGRRRYGSAVLDRRLLVFGDSYVAGVGDPEGRGWVGRVAAALHADGAGVTAYPLGVRGDTTADVALRWRAETAARTRDPGLDVRVVFATGANDSVTRDGAPRVDPARSAALLGELLDGARGLGLPALVVGPAPVGDPEADARVLALDARFAAVATLLLAAGVGAWIAG
jgi:acyl-CoA thioesterase I